MLVTLLALVGAVAAQCPRYEQWSWDRHEPFSDGQYKLPYMRPEERCRTYNVPEVEDVILKTMTSELGDPDLYRLFQNTWSNTVDTTVRWHGVSADDPEEEVCSIHLI